MGTVVVPVAKAARLSPSSRFAELVDAWLHQLGTTKPAANTVAAYRRDLAGVARRIAADAEAGVLHLEHLTKEALRAAFASWAHDHAAASMLRAHSSWSSFFDFLVAEDLAEGNPMAAVGKPRREAGAPRAIRDPDAAARLLATAAQPDPRGRDPWPERDLDLAATFCGTGIREAKPSPSALVRWREPPAPDVCRWRARGTRPGPPPSRAPWRRCSRPTW